MITDKGEKFSGWLKSIIRSKTPWRSAQDLHRYCEVPRGNYIVLTTSELAQMLTDYERVGFLRCKYFGGKPEWPTLAANHYSVGKSYLEGLAEEEDL